MGDNLNFGVGADEAQVFSLKDSQDSVVEIVDVLYNGLDGQSRVQIIGTNYSGWTNDGQVPGQRAYD